MLRLAWHAAEALTRFTARLERSDGEGGWTWRGTAFFIAPSSLLTCAHVVPVGEEFRIAWWDGKRSRKLPVTVASRHPAIDPMPEGPYPLPDVAVLATDEPLEEFPMVWLDSNDPGEDLWAFGYTDEYREDVALGHPARFKNAGEGQADEDGKLGVWRLKGDRVRPGMSGAPVLDLATARVVGIVKRSQDPTQDIGAFVTGMSHVLPVIPELSAENRDANATPDRDDSLAMALWGGLVSTAAAPLEDSGAARRAVAEELGIEADLHGDDEAQARRVARELFVVDLDRLVACVTRLADIVSPSEARKVFESVACCTSHRGEPWVAAEVAAELAAQVNQLAESEEPVGRVLHLRSALSELRPLYIARGDRRRAWWTALDSTLYSHVNDPATGLPADFERELRIGTARRFAQIQSAQRFIHDDLDAEARQAWNRQRPLLIGKLRARGVIGLLNCERLDARFVNTLVERYPLVFLVASGDEVASEVAEQAAYQALDPRVDDAQAEDALLSYGATCSELGLRERERLTA